MNRTELAVGLFSCILALGAVVRAAELHVAKNGNDANPGTVAAPLCTIQRAADLAGPGDVVTVHQGVYREQVAPPRGGTSDDKRIVYQAAPGEKIVVTGSEPAKGWQKVAGDTWKLTLPNRYFGKFNPYSDLIHGDWFGDNGRQHHTGAVYRNGHWLIEAAQFDDVVKPAGNQPMWFAKVDSVRAADYLVKNTTIWAQFPDIDPNGSDVEINVRKTVFTPQKTGINYITLRGFTLRNAATNWAPPTAGQIGLVSAYWCKGWIVENNDIGYSRCSGVALGKYSDEWDNRAESAEGYVGTLTRALKNGWNKDTVGGHVVRNNHIHHCEQTGVVGSLGCSFSKVIGNDIHDIHVQGLFGGAEMAGIKFHGAIDVAIRGNHVYRCGDIAGIWLDWMAQGAQVTRNLMHDNRGVYGDVFLEMQHGPILVANNLLLSTRCAFNMNSQGIAFAHNLIAGPIQNDRGDARVTPFHRAHTTELAGMYPAPQGDSGDHRFYNNLFAAPCTLRAIDNLALPCFAAGNVFTKGTRPSKFDKAPLEQPDFHPAVRLVEKPDGWYLDITLDAAWADHTRDLVTTKLLGKAKVPGVEFENPDSSRVKINSDYFGHKRNEANPFPGPFELPAGGRRTLKVWASR